MRLITNGLGALLVLTGNPALSASAESQPCKAFQYHQFDFWIGHWDVYRANGKFVGHSLIEPAYGCGIRENWMPNDGQVGGSLSTYVPAEHKWEQFWMDSSGVRVVFTGGWKGKAMVITGRWPENPRVNRGPLVKMTYTKNSDGSVRQFGEQSTDAGKTWKKAFDFSYRPSAGK